MFEPTVSPRDAASVIFNLPGYHVLDAVDLPLGDRRIVLRPDEVSGSCPECATHSSRVHAWYRQRVHDIPVGGDITEVVVVKPRLACRNASCARRTFTPTTVQLPSRARCLTRLRDALADAVVSSGRAVLEVAAAHRVAWWTVQAAVSAAALVLPDVDDLHVRRIGIDEHRYRRVRFFRDTDGKWARLEPWMTTIVNLASGQVLGVVDGRGSAGVRAWLTARTPGWRARVELVAIDPAAGFRSAVRDVLPHAQVSVDAFHLVQLANLMLTRVRQRLTRQTHGRRGRATDPAWAHRLLLLRGYDTLTGRARVRLNATFATDDPTHELSAAWAVKEQVRRLLNSADVQTAEYERKRLGCFVAAADMPETLQLWHTINDWWDEIEVLIATGATNARTEAANTSIKQIKRTGRGYRNREHYRMRILLRSARRSRQRQHLTQQTATLNCE